MSGQGRKHGFIGLGVLVVSEVLMLAGVRPFATWFYSLAWWSYIFIVDQAVYQRKGNSLWVNRRREFGLLIPASVFFWMIFEGINVYLKNWHYVDIIPQTYFRWPGYFIAYGTVLPALFETTELLEALGLFRGHRVRPLPRTRVWYGPFIGAGFFCLLAPIFWPRYFFPLIWGGLIFLFEPVLHARGGRSLMREWEEGSLRTFLRLLCAGLICGLLWEFWNFWAVSKWVYTVPLVGFLKVFEMPVLGFLGFPPFAVEAYVMYNLVSLLRRGRGWREEDYARPGGAPAGLVVLGLALFGAVFVLVARAIDLYTIHSYL